MGTQIASNGLLYKKLHTITLDIDDVLRNTIETGVGASLCFAEGCERYSKASKLEYAKYNLLNLEKQKFMDTKQDILDKETNIFKNEQPQFPYLISIPSSDNPSTVLNSLTIGTNIITLGSENESDYSLLEDLLQPPTILGQVIEAIATHWNALKIRGNSDLLPDDSYDVLNEKLRILMIAIDDVLSNRNKLENLSNDESKNASKPRNTPFVFAIQDFDQKNEQELKHWLQWSQEITQKRLAHVILTTTTTVTPLFMERLSIPVHDATRNASEASALHSSESESKMVSNSAFIAILMRIAPGVCDKSTAKEKLTALMNMHALLPLNSNTRNSDVNSQDVEDYNDIASANLTVLEEDKITQTVGNWWFDLHQICLKLKQKSIDLESSASKRVEIIEEVCQSYFNEVRQQITQELNVNKVEPLGPLQLSALTEELFSETVEYGLEAWHALSVITGLESPDSKLQTLTEFTKNQTTDVVSPIAVLMKFRSLPDGERHFFHMIDSQILLFIPKIDLEIGVTPCDPKSLVSPMWVGVRPIVKHAFQSVWRSDEYFEIMQKFEKLVTQRHMEDEINVYERELNARTMYFHQKREMFLQTSRDLSPEDHATMEAEVALLELEIISKNSYLEKLRSITRSISDDID